MQNCSYQSLIRCNKCMFPSFFLIIFKDEEQVLVKTVCMTLKKAQEMKMTSIAMPAISCGIFRYPIDKATHTILQAIGEFFRRSGQGGSLKTVVLIDVTDKTLLGFLLAAKQLFGRCVQVKDQPSSSAVGSRSGDAYRRSEQHTERSMGT